MAVTSKRSAVGVQTAPETVRLVRVDARRVFWRLLSAVRVRVLFRAHVPVTNSPHKQER